MMLFTTTWTSPVGSLRLFATDAALTGIYLENHKGGPALVASEREDHPVLLAARSQLAEYFAGERMSFALPLAPAGTPFQKTVWAALQEIPLGATWSYADLARHIGRGAGAARAVGAANARNPLCIVVPCHRVVGTGGALTGYAGGMPVKRWLLEHEQRFQRLRCSSGPCPGAPAPSSPG